MTRLSKRIGAALVFAMTASLLGGCGGGGGGTGSGAGSTPLPAAVVQAENSNTPVDPAIVAADNNFGLKLLNALIPGSTGNVAISPLSVALALQITYNGAVGDSQTAMAQALDLGSLSTSALNSDNAALQASLIDPDPEVQITIANSLWTGNLYPIAPSFTNANETYYGALLGNLSGAPDNVNAWVTAATHGLITQLLPGEPASFFQGLVALIGNAIYFKGQWTTAFNLQNTVPTPFTHSDGSQVSAEMMNQSGSYKYLQGTLNGAPFQVLQLPYGAGRLNMLIALPAASVSLGSFVAGITAAELSGWNAGVQTEPGSIALPRFTSTYAAALQTALTALGMGDAFCTSGVADFSGISAIQPPPCISVVEHQTVVEVDETGTVAAGSTGVGVGTAATIDPEFTMTMNHPFFYAIQDGKTGALLFAGVLMDPTASGSD